MVKRQRTVKIGCVIAAGGRRNFANQIPKVLETLEAGFSKPILVRVVKRALAGGILSENIIIIVNDQSEHAIQSALIDNDLGDIRIVVQYQRLGTANAVACALPFFAEKGVTDFLVMYGDMPRWSGRTIKELITAHTKHSPVVSMVTIRLLEGCPDSLYDYGIVLRQGKNGPIRSIVEPRCAVRYQQKILERNPSLYVFRKDWFLEVLASERVRPEGKRDRYTPEFHLSGYVRIACQDHRKIHVCRLPDERLLEALGVNKREDLRVVRMVEAQHPSGD